MTDTGDNPTIVVADDEPAVADTYELRLGTDYETRVAYGGQEALDHVDDDVDVVLLDRRMPNLSGDDVLDRIREQEYGCRVVMSTAVEPDYDIVDMPFDDYLCKPIQREELLDAIEKQLGAESYDDRLGEYMEVTRKIQLLEAEKGEASLADNEDVQELRDRAATLRDELDLTVSEFDDSKQAFDDLM